MTEIACPQGFFQNDTVTPATVTDLVSAVAAAQANVSGAATSAAAAANSASAAALGAALAGASQTAAASSQTAAATSASSASASASTATTQAANAASSATAAAGSATSAGNSATSATSSKNAAASSATAAANSAGGAATSAANASTSATSAANSASSVSTAANANVGRNRFHNGLFRVAQRGAGAFTSSGYTADRWRVDVAGGDAFSASVVALTDADRTAIGDDDATNAIQIVTTATNTSSSQTVSKQRIEGVRTLAGKQVTVSFYGKLASGSATIGMSYRQSFGTGGSPSGDVTGAINTASVGVGSLTRFTATFTLPSTSGKTLGSNGDDFLELNFWLSCAPGNANVSLAGNIGVQSKTFTLTGFQVELGPTATALEHPHRPAELANCQRFYTSLQAITIGQDFPASGQACYMPVTLPATMRATPSVAFANTSYAGNAGSLAVQSSSGSVLSLRISSTGTGTGSCLSDVLASADL